MIRSLGSARSWTTISDRKPALSMRVEFAVGSASEDVTGCFPAGSHTEIARIEALSVLTTAEYVLCLPYRLLRLGCFHHHKTQHQHCRRSYSDHEQSYSRNQHASERKRSINSSLLCKAFDPPGRVETRQPRGWRPDGISSAQKILGSDFLSRKLDFTPKTQRV